MGKYSGNELNSQSYVHLYCISVFICLCVLGGLENNFWELVFFSYVFFGMQFKFSGLTANMYVELSISAVFIGPFKVRVGLPST